MAAKRKAGVNGAPGEQPTTSRKAAKSTQAAKIAVPAAPRPKRVNKAIANKVQQVKEFLTTDYYTNSVIRWDKTNPNYAKLTESDLLGALMTLHVDWQLSGDAKRANILDVQDITIETFTQNMGTHAVPTKCFTLDLTTQSIFVNGILLKITGHGLHGTNLLRVQLEMNERANIEQKSGELYTKFLDAYYAGHSEGPAIDGANEALHSADEEETGDEQRATASITETNAGSGEQTAVEDNDTATSIDNGSADAGEEIKASVGKDETEVERRGVCPAPAAV